jgi:dipeptidyl aminopeptidase/acylaminoacyl peptidase
MISKTNPWALATAIALIFGLAPGSVSAEPTHDFTLEQILSAPFPSDLTASPVGGRVAWVSDDRGVRNVWVAETGPDRSFHAHPLTTYAGDDGFDLGELSWDPEGSQIFYTRGGSLEGGGPVNIMSLPSGAPPQKVWAVDIAGGAPREVGDGHTPVVSPRGDRVAYLSGGQVWTAPSAGGAATQRIHDRGQDSQLVWSPDGSHLAFVSTRTDHSLVGVLDIAADRIAWMAPSVDTDLAPEWSPDGRHIAFVRTPAGGDYNFQPRREGSPWSIWICDPATGVGKPIWVAAAGRGSVFQGTLGDRVLMWTAGDRIVFPWERSGWLHLYAIPAMGGRAVEVTPGGAFEVFNTTLGPDRAMIAYSANNADTDRWHLYEVTSATGAVRTLTSGKGIEDYPVFTSNGRLVALHSSARDPVRPVAVDGGAMADLAPSSMPSDFPSGKLVEPQSVTFAASDGQMAHGQLFLPPPGHRKPGPAILFFHGGPVRQMLLGWHPMDAYSFMYGMNQYLADDGYVVLSVNYRGGIGYGLDYREAPGFGPSGASEANDVRGAALYLKSRPDVDPSRIGIWGGSYGGLMTALGLARDSDLLAAGVDYAGVHDWRPLLPKAALETAPKGAEELAYKSSAISSLDTWKSPVLVVQADDDRNVPFAQTVELVEGLRKHSVEVEQVVIPDEIHDLLRERSWLTLFHAADDFFGRKLTGAPVNSGN